MTTSRPMNDVCILETKFGLKQYLWARWISPNEAQVHDGSRIVARLAWAPYNRRGKAGWVVDIMDLAQPHHSWAVNMRTLFHTTPELAWTRMTREANKSWTAAHPDA